MNTKRSGDQAVGRIIAELQNIPAWWNREQDRLRTGTPLAGRIDKLVRRLKREYPDANNR